MVLCFHLSQSYFNFSNGNGMFAYDTSLNFSDFAIFLIVGFFGKGYLGVYLFFMLSGYLIYSIYDFRREINWLEFFRKRFWRIYPIYFVLLSFFFLVFHRFDDVRFLDFLFHLFFIHNFKIDTFYSINPSFWSLAVEIQFYLLFPILSFFSKKYSVVSVFIVTVFLSFLVVYFNMVDHYTFTSTFKFLFMWQFGGVLYKQKENLSVIYQKYQMYFLLVFVFLYYLIAFSSKDLGFFQFYSEFTFCVLLFIIILFTKINFIRYSFRFLFQKFFYFFAVISYGLYLIHQPLLNPLKLYFKGVFGSPLLNFVIEIVFIVIVLILLTYSLFQLVELKVLNLVKKYFSN
jgi:peptidoglycan/LPS O-acetylase OafA/YrhL